MTATVPEHDASQEDVESDAYNAFVAGMSLVAVDVVKIEGERHTPGEASQTQFDLAASYQIENNALHYRFDVAGRLTDDAGIEAGQVAASVVVTVTAPALPSQACIEQFGGMSAAMMAHPYLREVIASTAQRLGFQGSLLPIIVQQPGSETRPQSDLRGKD